MRMRKCIPEVLRKTEDVYLKDEGNEDLALSRTQEMRCIYGTVFWLVVVSIPLSSGVATELCVVPSELSSCPCNTSCHTFDYYLSDSETFFVDNTTFLFLPGVHEVHGLYNGFGVSGMNFTGNNASLIILTDSSLTAPWFSLTNGNSVSFSGLAVSTCASLYTLFSLTNIGNVEMTNMVMESNCTTSIFLTESTGYFKFHNVVIRLTDTSSGTRFMTSFFNVNGLISISESIYYYLGPQFALLAINILYSNKFITNTTIIVVDTEIYRSGVAFGFVLSDFDASDTDSSFLDILVENVLISGPYYTGLGLEIAAFWGFCNITILNSEIQGVNGTALSLGLDNPFTPSAVIKNSQLRWNYGRENYGVAMVIRGYNSAYPAVVELVNVTVESNTYSDTVTTMMVAVNSTMSDCAFMNNTGTAVFLEDSFLECSGHNEFTANIGYEGACLSLGEGSRIFLATNETRLTFAHNTANYTGGAIYLRTNRASYIQLLLGYSHAWCFVQEKPPSNSIFLFDSNTAKNGGDDIFGEYFDFTTFGNTVYYCIDVIANMSTFAQKSVSSVTSPPSRVCLCEDDGTARCLEYERSVSIYPGQTVGIQAFTVGQQFGTVRGAVYAQILNKSSSTIIPSEQKVQTVGIRNCTDAINTLKYKLATGESETLVLTAVNIVVSEFVNKAEIDAIIVQYRENLKQNITHVPRQLVTLPLFINLDTLSCPRGFALGDSGCQCDATFLHHVGRYRVSCDIDTQSIGREYSVWVDATNTTSSYSKQCPLVYCNPDFLQVNLSNVDGADLQCLHHRSGVLCGGCRKNFSLAIGSSNCLADCSNRYLSLLAVFAVAGVLLVLAIKYLNLTVTQGLISGLVLYANIVQTNKGVLLSSNEVGVRVFATIIAWFNFDFGIETCFSGSLDMYLKTWLQFVFPLYLWILAGGIILACRYSQLATRFFGNNTVHVLATIFLLSYNKLLRVVIAVYSATNIQVQNERIVVVWTYDGNILYLGPQHASLFAVSTAVFLTLWLPFTVLILLGHWLQRYNHLRGLKWLGKLRPLFDEYYGPLKDRRRYWVGILLLARVCVIFPAADPLASVEASLLAIVFVALVLLLLLLLFGKVYRKYYISLFEVVSLVNLKLFAILSLYYSSTGGRQETAVYISAGIFLSCLILVISIQLYVTILHKLLVFCKKGRDAYVPIDEEQLPDLIIDGRS